ncbi:MAG: tetratricopeptide repeat protein [Pirellulales bacterium]
MRVPRTSSLAAVRGRTSLRWRGWVFCVVALQICCGCRVLSKGPVPQDVADCRKLSQRAIGALHKGDLPAAESLAQRAVQTNPDDVQARQTYSESLWRNGRRDAALLESQAAWKLAGEDPLVATRLGEQYFELGRHAEAAELAAEAIDLCPECGAAWALRARAEAAQGRLPESLNDYQRALRSSPNDRRLLMEVAGIYRQLRQPRRAWRSWGNCDSRTIRAKSRRRSIC